MVIEEKDFRLTPINDSSPLFDLEILHTVKPKSGEPREEFKNAGYGLPLEHALRRVASYRIQKNNEVISIKEYLKQLNEIIQEFNKLCTTN